MHTVRTQEARPRRTLGQALAEGTVLLDGGLSNQLEAQGAICPTRSGRPDC